MATKIYATDGDTNRVVTVTLADDGVGRDLTVVDAIQCHLRDRSTGTATVIAGLTGNASGVVSTTVAACVEGVYTIEFEVTDGAQVTTYPANGSERPLFIVRAEAD